MAKKKLIDLIGLSNFKENLLSNIQNRLSNYIEINTYQKEQNAQNNTISDHYSEVQERLAGIQNQLSQNSTNIQKNKSDIELINDETFFVLDRHLDILDFKVSDIFLRTSQLDTRVTVLEENGAGSSDNGNYVTTDDFNALEFKVSELSLRNVEITSILQMTKADIRQNIVDISKNTTNINTNKSDIYDLKNNKVDMNNGTINNPSLILEELPDEGIDTNFVAYNDDGTNKLYKAGAATISYSLFEDGYEVKDYNENFSVLANYEVLHDQNGKDIYNSRYAYISDIITQHVFKPYFNVVHFSLPLLNPDNKTGFKSIWMTLYKIGPYISLYNFQFLLQENYSDIGNIVYDSPHNDHERYIEELSITKEELFNNVKQYTRNLPFTTSNADIYKVTNIGSLKQNDYDGLSFGTLHFVQLGGTNPHLRIGITINSNSYDFSDGENYCLYVLSTSIDRV